MDEKHCAWCGIEFPTHEPGYCGGAGYGENRETGERFCYLCCGVQDAQSMQETGRAILYLCNVVNRASGGCDGATVTNWPGTLVFPIRYVKVGRHNIARHRYDVWFRAYGRDWHGTTYGDNTQICHVRAVK